LAVLEFDKVNRIIEVKAPDTEIDVQELINKIREWEADINNMEVAQVAEAAGKADLGGGRFTVITLKLLNWKLKREAEATPLTFSVTGGNFIAVDALGNPMNPFEPSTNISYDRASATTGALIAEWTQAQINNYIAVAEAIKSKTDNLPSDPASESKLLGDHTVMKEPTANAFNREEDSLARLSDKLDEILIKVVGERFRV